VSTPQSLWPLLTHCQAEQPLLKEYHKTKVFCVWNQCKCLFVLKTWVVLALGSKLNVNIGSSQQDFTDNWLNISKERGVHVCCTTMKLLYHNSCYLVFFACSSTHAVMRGNLRLLGWAQAMLFGCCTQMVSAAGCQCGRQGRQKLNLIMCS